MEQLIYISTARSEHPDRALVDEILVASRRNNGRDGLTGLLLVGGRRFLQVLEGPKDELQTAYARIRQDPRHFAVVELSRRPIAERSFPEWAMGHNVGGAEEMGALVERVTAGVEDPSLKAQLRSFAEMHKKAA